MSHRKKSKLSLVNLSSNEELENCCEMETEIFLFFPNEQDIIATLSGSVSVINDEPRYIRKIFEVSSDKYLPYEIKELENFKSEIKLRKLENIINLDEWKDSEILKFLQSNNWKCGPTIAEMQVRNDLKNYPIYSITSNINQILKTSQAFYVLGRDNALRPNIYIDEEKLKDIMNQYGNETVFRAVIIFLTHIQTYLLVPGQIENWNLILKLSLDNSNVIKVPTELRTYINFLYVCFKCKINKLYIYPYHPWAIFNLKSILTADTVKGSFQKKEEDFSQIFSIFRSRKELNENLSLTIHQEQREEKYGGVIKRIDSYFPPQHFSSNYFLDNLDANKSKLISKEDYMTRLNTLSIYQPPKSILTKLSISSFSSNNNQTTIESFASMNSKESSDELDQISLVDDEITSFNKPNHTPRTKSLRSYQQTSQIGSKAISSAISAHSVCGVGHSRLKFNSNFFIDEIKAREKCLSINTCLST